MQNFKVDWPALKSKFKRYLAELFVVIFGVYLGFMANNYAEELKQREYLYATIKEMYHSLEQDIHDAALNKGGHENGIRAVNYFNRILQNQRFDIDSFGLNYVQLTRNYVSIQNTSPFETIRSKGYDVITNDSLRRKMIKVYDFQYEVLEKVEEKYQESQLYANESYHINEILDKSLVFDDSLKLKKIILPLNITNEERSRLILILKRINSTRAFNIGLYEKVLDDMKSLRENLADVYPFVLKE